MRVVDPRLEVPMLRLFLDAIYSREYILAAFC